MTNELINMQFFGVLHKIYVLYTTDWATPNSEFDEGSHPFAEFLGYSNFHLYPLWEEITVIFNIKNNVIFPTEGECIDWNS